MTKPKTMAKTKTKAKTDQDKGKDYGYQTKCIIKMQCVETKKNDLIVLTSCRVILLYYF